MEDKQVFRRGVCPNCECKIDFKDAFAHDGFCDTFCQWDYIERVQQKHATLDA